MKMKEFGPPGASLALPLGSANVVRERTKTIVQFPTLNEKINLTQLIR